MINFFDIYVVIMVTVLGIVGFREGLVRGVINLVGFIALVVALAMFSDIVTTAARSFTAIPPQASIPLMFVLLLALGSIAIHLIALVIHKAIHMTPVGVFDSALGTLLGILKAVIFCALLAVVLAYTPDGSWFRTQYNTSASAGGLVRMLHTTIPLIERTLAPYFRTGAPMPPLPPPSDEGPGPRLNDAI